ncbi:hypothetical protein [Mucilaginibacter pocheonensis]|uniref:Fimbrillin family protein n=1 Tax=Mucilaginibacter pocheonensis TaxID=398050 RepID=A0ABU1THQ6_9SPHI|nr:hypothetical protein [Mucilaginibacter pocheonensis]MDR6944947.1 hypothetical protein [Mucilaginibacter pocheonensis]
MNNLYPKLFILLLLTITINSCKPDPALYPTRVVPIPGYKGDDAGTNTGTYYFKGTLDGQALNWQETTGVDGWVVGSAAATSNDQGNITGNLSALLSAAKTLQPSVAVEIGTFHVLADADKSVVFNSFVTTGSWAFGTENNAIDARYVTISYTDSEGNFYTSAKGAQTGTVNIVSVTPVPKEPGKEEGLKIKLTFSCTLYPEEGSGASLTLTNAETTLWFENGL